MEGEEGRDEICTQGRIARLIGVTTHLDDSEVLDPTRLYIRFRWRVFILFVPAIVCFTVLCCVNVLEAT